MISQSEIQRFLLLKRAAKEAEEELGVAKSDLQKRLRDQEDQEEGGLSLYFKPYTKTITRYKEVVEKMMAWLMTNGKPRTAQKLEGFLAESSRPLESQYMDIRQVEEVVVKKSTRIK